VPRPLPSHKLCLVLSELDCSHALENEIFKIFCAYKSVCVLLKIDFLAIFMILDVIYFRCYFSKLLESNRPLKLKIYSMFVAVLSV
jgi:hypothetical protein